MQRTWKRALGALALVALVAAGCGGDDDAEDTTGTTAAAGQDGDGREAGDDGCTEDRIGGSVTMATLTQPRALDPIVAAGAGTTGGNEMAAVYDTLVRYDPDSNSYEPHLAESLEPDDDHAEWTLTLREGVTFGNGDPLDAQAVQASIERFQGEENTGPYRALSLLITEMEVVDERTLVLRLDEGWAGFPFLLANSAGMVVNTDVADTAGEGFGTSGAGAGAGPYEIARYAADEEIVLRAKDDYWGGPVCIEELRFVTVAGDSAAYDAFRSGELQAASLRDPVMIEQAADDGVDGLSNLQNAGNVLLINNGVRDSQPPTTDVRLRRAIQAAIDVDAVAQRVYDGAGNPTKAILSDKSRLWQDDDALAGPDTDPDLARRLVEEVKADTDWDGSISLVCPQAREDAGLAMQAQLDAVGFDVDFQRLATTGDLVDRVIVRADFELSCWGLNYLDSALWPTMNNTMRSDSSSNYGGYADPEYDAAMDDLRVASSEDDQREAIARAQAAWIDTVPAVILEALETTIIHQEELRGLRLTSNSIVLFADAYLD